VRHVTLIVSYSVKPRSASTPITKAVRHPSDTALHPWYTTGIIGTQHTACVMQ
jgi:hypothetical protein